MPKQGKKYRDALEKVPRGVRFQPDEALELVRELSFARFDETVEVATRLSVDPRKADQIVRGTVVLPHGTGKAVRVLVIAEGEKAQEAKDAGADYVGTDYVEKIQGGGSTSTSWWRPPTRWGRWDRWDVCSGPAGSCPRPRPGP
jgi:large subunit ribosomal protein L1